MAIIPGISNETYYKYSFNGRDYLCLEQSDGKGLSISNIIDNNMYKYEIVWLIDDSEIDNFIHTRLFFENYFAKSVYSFNGSVSTLEYLWLLCSQQNNIIKFPSIIFLDLNMVWIDGLSLLNIISEWPKTFLNKLNIVILTSSISPEDRNKATSHNFVCNFINRPLTNKSLSSIIIKWPKQLY